MFDQQWMKWKGRKKLDLWVSVYGDILPVISAVYLAMISYSAAYVMSHNAN